LLFLAWSLSGSAWAALRRVPNKGGLMDTPDDDLLAFSDDADAAEAGLGVARRSWQVMVIDDDEDVHQATRFALGGVQLFGCSIELLHARSAAEAREVLRGRDDIAVILLDVVMETPDAGLQLVAYLREELKLRATRIVLRTGQPGYAPEHETLLQYDINDYKTKSELTHHKLLTTITSTLRAYEQIRLIETSRSGLEQIVHAAGAMLDVQGLNMFASGVITQLSALLRAPVEGLVCAQKESGDDQSYRVLAAAGSYSGLLDKPIDVLPDAHAVDLLKAALTEARSQFFPTETVIYLGQRGGVDMAAYVRTERAIEVIDVQLLNVFCTNLNACLRNLALIQRLHKEAYEDPLLRIPNRTKFIEQAWQQGLEGRSAVVALLDLDDFASVNDLMGLEFADQVLRAVSLQLRRQLDAKVLVARVSSNGFGLLGPASALAAEHLVSLFHAPLTVCGQPYRVQVTVGMYGLTGQEQDGAECLKNAGMALKQAKREQRGHSVWFRPDMAHQARNRAQLLSNLHNAFDQDRLYMAYQPQIDLQTGAWVGLEALMRWRTEQGTFVAPDKFIPVAEQSGLIIALGEWAMNEAFRDMRRLIDQGDAPARMAVNVSPLQFQESGFLVQLQTALARAGLAPERVELEITESVSLLGRGVIEPLLAQLRDMGISIAIDDFGTGYSSLSYVEQLPLDKIKIDKAFVRQIDRASGPRIAELIAQLGHKMGLRVLAEGIESAAAWHALQDMGCHEGQGFLMAHPMAWSDLLRWMCERPRRAAGFL